MAKEFKGFTPQQQFMLLKRMGYTGPQDQAQMNNFMASSPEIGAKMGRFAEQARDRVGKVQMASGGLFDPSLINVINKGGSGGNNTTPQNADISDLTPMSLEDAQSAFDDAKGVFATAQANASANPNDKTAQAQLTTAQKQLQSAQTAYSALSSPSAAEVTADATNNPTSMVTPANVDQIVNQDNQNIAAGTGNAGDAPQGQATTVDQAAQAQTPDAVTAATVDPEQVTADVKQELEGLEAATADPSAQATVRGQLELLMEDFEGGGTPPWASGAMREAMAVMQRRGMGASTMAGAAVVQAAMESAIGIASQDAATHAQFEMQNLNNQQQTSIFKTQQTISAMLSDQAAENAGQQFNAASENQVNQFMADLQSTISRFNADQVNTITQFNAGEKNAMEQFNSSLKAQREQFNAQNDLVIAQANTKWRQDIATLNSAAQNQANMQTAQAANGLTTRALDYIWQTERDIMNFAFASSESAQQRKHELLMANRGIQAQEDASTKEAIGYIAGRLLFG